MASFNLRQPAPRHRPPRERVTLDDVAAAAGVSRQTVSNVVNGTGRLSERTRTVVTEAITALDYHPHRGARGLRSRKTLLLGHPMPLVEPDENNWVMTEWVGSLVSAAGDRGYHVLLTAGVGVEAVESLARSGTVDAFILADVGRRDLRAAFLVKQGIPFTCFGRLDRPLPQSWVDIDDRASIRGVVAHLASRGHRRIGFVGLATGRRWDLAKVAGFRAGLADAGLSAAPGHVLAVAHVVPQAIDPMFEGRDVPTAIVAASDTLAAAVYAAAAARNLRVGAEADLAVTGFDGSAAGRALTPSLTTVAVPRQAIAVRIVDRVLREIEGPTGAAGEILETTLTIGDSA